MFGDDPFPFMNFGYLDPRRGAAEEPDPECPEIAEQLSINLYEKVLEGVELAGGTVVEVGSGRGGGAAHVAVKDPTARVTAVDRSHELIRLCESSYSLPNLSFIQGEAEALPIDRDAVDVVVNVESSHGYESRSRFVNEVARVLHPSGVLAMTDVLLPDRPESTPSEVESAMRAAGLEVLVSEDISVGVLEARRAASRSPAFNDRLETVLQPKGVNLFRRLLCMEGSGLFERMENGDVTYWRWLARKRP